ncbi:MAG: hypothetical protein V4608_10205 [Bacteroidota bacterium]
MKKISNNISIRSQIICLFLLISLCLIVPGCRKEEKLFDVNPVALLPPNSGKTKLKTNEQYIAILHANLFQTALSANQIFDIGQCMESIGDQELARELVISNFMNKPGTIIPSKAEMAADVNKFIVDSYNRFLVRNPTEAEKTYFENYLTARITPADTIMPELVYVSFALSNEYMYY